MRYGYRLGSLKRWTQAGNYPWIRWDFMDSSNSELRGNEFIRASLLCHKRKACSTPDFTILRSPKRIATHTPYPGSPKMSQNSHNENMFSNTQVPVTCSGSSSGSCFVQDDLSLDMPRTESSGLDMESTFGLATQEWVSTQSSLLPPSGNLISSVETPFTSAQDGLNIDAWPSVSEAHGSLPLWSMASIAPSVSEFTHHTDTISDSSSPITSASMGEIEGSCSPELVMPPLAMAPSIFDPITPHGSLPEFDHWNVSPSSYLPLDTPKANFSPSDVSAPSVSSPVLDQPERRPSHDSDPQKARSDWRYSLLPGDDGLYHCPFVPCSHSPDKLKCNYDKHLDSHLKPYRCKVKACQEIAFSSTACVLRHEREAHGMHGHGNKPFTCVFPECDRSRADNGFPRRWNLHDHMRRMHNYTPKAGSDDAAEPHAVGPSRTKRGSRTSPKPRISKDDTIKASSNARKNSRSLPKAWLEEQAMCAPPANYMSYAPAVDVSQMSPASLYAPWNPMS